MRDGNKSQEVIDNCLQYTQLSFRETMREIYHMLVRQKSKNKKLVNLFKNGSKDDYIQLWKYFKEILAVFSCDNIDFVLRQGHTYAFHYKHIDYIKNLFEEYSSPNFKKMRRGNFAEVNVEYVINAVEKFRDFISDYISTDTLPQYKEWVSQLYSKTDFLLLSQKRIQNDYERFLGERINGLITDKAPYDTYLLTLSEKLEWLGYVHKRLKNVEYELITILQEMDDIKSDALIDAAIDETPNVYEHLSEVRKYSILNDYLNYKIWQTDELQVLLEQENELRAKPSVNTPKQLDKLFDEQRKLASFKKQELLQKMLAEHRIDIPEDFDIDNLIKKINAANKPNLTYESNDKSLLKKAIENITNNESV